MRERDLNLWFNPLDPEFKRNNDSYPMAVLPTRIVRKVPVPAVQKKPSINSGRHPKSFLELPHLLFSEARPGASVDFIVPLVFGASGQLVQKHLVSLKLFHLYLRWLQNRRRVLARRDRRFKFLEIFCNPSRTRPWQVIPERSTRP